MRSLLAFGQVLLFAQAWGEDYIRECGSEMPVNCLVGALRYDGAVAVQVKGMLDARKDALTSIAKCVEASPQVATILADGTRRASVASQTVADALEPIDGCPEATEHSSLMRKLVSLASKRFLETLQPMVNSSVGMRRSSGGRYSSLVDIAREGTQLEHFHTYEPTVDAASDIDSSLGVTKFTMAKAALPLHVDAGLFISIVPALQVRSTNAIVESGATDSEVPPEDGFYVERRDGSRARVRPTTASSSVIFVLGDGWTEWINPMHAVQMRAAPHAMVMLKTRAASIGRITRVWYGKMFLPPEDAVLTVGGTPFGKTRSEYPKITLSTSNFNEHALKLLSSSPATAMQSGCGGRRLMTTADPSNCKEEGKLHCWMICMPLPSCPAGQHAICKNATGWCDPNVMQIPECHAGCSP